MAEGSQSNYNLTNMTLLGVLSILGSIVCAGVVAVLKTALILQVVLGILSFVTLIGGAAILVVAASFFIDRYDTERK